MRCDEVLRLLDLYLDAELPEETAPKVERHLLQCQSCAFEMRGLEQTRRMLCDASVEAGPSPSFRERTAARLLDALSTHLRPTPTEEAVRQWKLPFGREE